MSSGEHEAGRRGRWRTGAATRSRILDAAKARFASDGYEHATMRAIAADAQVDPGMVHYFFGRKDQLFAAAMDAPDSPRAPVTDLLAQGLDDLGPRLVRRFLEVWDASGHMEPLLVLARSTQAGDRSTTMLREFIQHEFVDLIARHLGTPDAPLRAGLITAQLFGLAFARYVVRADSIATTDHDTLTAWLGPIVQDILTGPDRKLTDSPPATTE
jgi:AcrR family transcriptional regulator